jgi:hypothetical protein
MFVSLRDQSTTLRPWRTRIRKTTTAGTLRGWIHPPSVQEVTIPDSHKTTKITKIAPSLRAPYLPCLGRKASAFRPKIEGSPLICVPLPIRSVQKTDGRAAQKERLLRHGPRRRAQSPGTHRSKRMKNAASAVGILATHGSEDVRLCWFKAESAGAHRANWPAKQPSVSREAKL